MRTTLIVHNVAAVWDKTLPAKVVATALACHVVAAAVLGDVGAALGTWLCAHVRNRPDRLLVFLLFGFATAATTVPGTVAGEAELVLAVGTGDLLLDVALCISLTVLDREVFATFGEEAGNEFGASGDIVFEESLVVVLKERVAG